ncbi:MAG: Asp-tRNA(Asn)/Glu-tRNA(Gln) amidotransferase subunit GatC [bacterium]|nr:Asp-tRNA(Asn)/Glu-tRNA(Gln) amidotransferase subunit GatC [Patescibacteria group bacterium]MDW8279551.1 Asp-tRNA(Asn)/Glu-tRNA(Gln) amidotransferase subunit GatC [bacterium]
MEEINKSTTEYLAKLARIKLTEKEKENLSYDLKKIINHFNELNQINAQKIPPMTGGTNLKNVFRKDIEENCYTSKGIKNFPDEKNKFLKVPKVL